MVTLIFSIFILNRILLIEDEKGKHEVRDIENAQGFYYRGNAAYINVILTLLAAVI